MSWSFIAQRAATGEFLDWDLPLDVSALEWELSGPGSLTGSISPDVGRLRADDGALLLDEWGTLVYAEHDGVIRWGGVVVDSSADGESWTVEAAGFSTYPHGIPYLGHYVHIGVDPADAFRELWRHVQSWPDSDLGVAVTGASTPVRIGLPARTEPDGDGGTRDVEAEPYSLVWWESPDCGQEMQELAGSTPFDWVEKHRWSDDRESIIHEVEIGYPRLGRRRTDLVFADGENITRLGAVEANGDEYANTILGLGAGEGREMLRRETGLRDGRLRRVHVHADKAINDARRLDSVIADELTCRRPGVRISSFDVIDHPHARIGSWQLGDDVLVRAELPWIGEFSQWCRVVGWSLTGESSASLSVVPSDSFRYGGVGGG